MKTTRILLLAMIPALMLGSCVKENQIDKTEKTGDVPIDIMIAGSDYVETRGTAATTANINGTFKIYAYEKTTLGVYSDHGMSGGVIATLNATGGSRTATLADGPYNWPASNGLDFYAVYPSSWTSTATKNGTTPFAPKVTTGTHTVNTSMAAQTDILYAYNTETAKGSSVDLEFQHALTKVTFQGQVTNNASANMAGAQITQIKILNAVKSGVFTFTNASDGAWTPTGTETFTASGLTHGISTAAPGTTYTDPFFVIPMNNPAGSVKLEVTVKWTGNSTGTTFTNISLPDTVASWGVGKWVNYVLTLDAGKEIINVGAVTVKEWSTTPDNTGTVPIN